ncbi:hypothetical protein J3459_016656 [Metarhizium acridum]|uniref:F-box domain protein n=1 Tax=Metarhizium acridum (strain CQMa 102) TaxID=655827 RepID=E9E4Y7_METAQ|nr:F-box domain protein [Metarhizium acridum CQMa 102]EFY89004.1 F-box domain protein [Metarhizium acridum CQMa 102]KAG8404846.1 hypothetical protein J3459_016656 [Metarhizium acridum]
MERVLSLPELLERIFLQLDMTTLLASVQRVSKIWNNTIAFSPALQQKLFFRPITAEQLPAFRKQLMREVETTGSAYLRPELTKSVLNPLLVKKFGCCFFDTGPAFGYQRGADCFNMLPWSPNHRKLISIYRPRWTYPYHQVEPPKQLDEASSQLEETSRARFTTRGASWRRMVVSQPAPPGIGYLIREVSRELRPPKEFIGEAFIPAVTTGGAQMGQLYDMVQYHAGHHKSNLANFRVIWELPQPFMTEHLREPMRQLLGQTTLLVLFAFSHLAFIREPENVVDFDSAFRCEEFFLPDFVVKKAVRVRAREADEMSCIAPSYEPPSIYLD